MVSTLILIEQLALKKYLLSSFLPLILFLVFQFAHWSLNLVGNLRKRMPYTQLFTNIPATLPSQSPIGLTQPFVVGRGHVTSSGQWFSSGSNAQFLRGPSNCWSIDDTGATGTVLACQDQQCVTKWLLLLSQSPAENDDKMEQNPCQPVTDIWYEQDTSFF